MKNWQRLLHIVQYCIFFFWWIHKLWRHHPHTAQEEIIQGLCLLQQKIYCQHSAGITWWWIQLWKNNTRVPTHSKTIHQGKGQAEQVCKAMIISDNRKAATVGEYVKIILHKDIVPPPNLQPDDMSCAFSIFLMQLPNHDYFYNSETGEVYSDNDFRNQMVVYWKCSSDASKT